MEDKDLITLTEAVERGKSNTHLIEDLKTEMQTQIAGVKDEIKDIKSEQRAIYDIATSVKLIAQDMNTMKETINEVKQGQVEMAEKVDYQISEIKVDVKQGQNTLEEKIIAVDSKSKIELWNFIKTKVIPVILTGGIIYTIVEIVKIYS